jgi:4-carboxymuconolactone decarboxylase
MKGYEARMKRGNTVIKKMGREGLLGEQKDSYPDLHELTVGHLFGDIWTRPHLTLRERQLITLAANIALTRPTGNHSHYHSALQLGITKDQIMELIIHVGHYAGWPTIGFAMRQFNRVLKSYKGRKKKPAPEEVREMADEWER